ncbi:MAG: hypothetical protein WCG47_13055 [Dermatophilaceae bacterium]
MDTLHRVTQGWPAGVRMALLAMRAGRSPRLSLDLVHADSLAEYLSTEVLSSLDDEMRDFVAEATVHEMVCPSLVDSVRGEKNARVLLERCVAQGLFLTRDEQAQDCPPAAANVRGVTKVPAPCAGCARR